MWSVAHSERMSIANGLFEKEKNTSASLFSNISYRSAHVCVLVWAGLLGVRVCVEEMNVWLCPSICLVHLWPNFYDCRYFSALLLETFSCWTFWENPVRVYRRLSTTVEHEWTCIAARYEENENEEVGEEEEAEKKTESYISWTVVFILISLLRTPCTELKRILASIQKLSTENFIARSP